MDLLPLLDELQTIARNGLTYVDDPHDAHDRERYERILHLVSEGYGRSLDLPSQEVRDRLSADEFGHITPKVGAAAAIFDDDGRLLLVKQPETDDTGSGTWVMPGGYVDSGEQPSEAAVRETHEETGLDVRPLSLVDGYWIDAPAKDGPHGAVTLLYYCLVVGGELAASNESQAARYWRIEDVPEWFSYAQKGALDAREIWLDHTTERSVGAKSTPEQPRTRVTSDPGSGVNEDLGGVTTRAAWVLDGATGITEESLTPGMSDAQWYVQQFDRFLRHNIGDQERDLRTIVRDGVRTVAETFDTLIANHEIDRAAEPSAACSIVRWTGGTLETFVLGDCSAMFTYLDGEIQHVTDDRQLLRRLEGEAVNGMHRFMTEHELTALEARELIRPKQADNRRKLRRSNEHWSLSLDPDASESGRYTRIDVAAVKRILLFSDGVGRLVNDLMAFDTWQELAEWTNAHGHDTTIDRLRTIERSDSRCIEYPRIKAHDDATLVSVDFD